MENITKEQALAKIEELKAFVAKEETKSEVKLEIKSWSGRICFSSTKSTVREAVIEAVESEANLSGANLSGANLSRADLREANLSEADLSGADLREANLSEADLSGANLRGADLSGADLSRADLSEAEMQNAKFYGKTSIPKLLKPYQVDDFLSALGLKIDK
jgi:uncharacterized protein YjbI with pentapeptide repeats